MAADPAHLRHALGSTPSETIGTPEILQAAGLLGLRAKRVHSQASRLALTRLPALALMAHGSVALLAQSDGQRVLIQAFGEGGSARCCW